MQIVQIDVNTSLPLKDIVHREGPTHGAPAGFAKHSLGETGRLLRLLRTVRSQAPWQFNCYMKGKHRQQICLSNE